MTEPIGIGIMGYGNIGRAVEQSLEQNADMTIKGIFTRRDPQSIKPLRASTAVYPLDRVKDFSGDVDVAILCGGSATDLPEQGPAMAALFNTVDSYDTHALIPRYFKEVDAAARKAGTVAVVSTGWDPGLFSLMRVIEESVLPRGESYTFWGPGVSQGHSDAIRRIPGVKDARQYTIPHETAVERVRSGQRPNLTARDKHLRDCYVVAAEGAHRQKIEQAIRNMPHYFSDYDTKVTFISEEEMTAKHSAMPHGGFVMRTGDTNKNDRHVIEFGLRLDSNPAFTASVLVAYARAAYRLFREGARGGQTVFDIAPRYLSPMPPDELINTQL